MDISPDIEIKDSVPLVQNSMTKKIAYIMAFNAMGLIDGVVLASIFKGYVIPTIVVTLILVKLIMATLLLGYLKSLHLIGK